MTDDDWAAAGAAATAFFDATERLITFQRAAGRSDLEIVRGMLDFLESAGDLSGAGVAAMRNVIAVIEMRPADA